MKLGILFSLLLIGCGATPSEKGSDNKVTVDDSISLPGGGGGGPMPCDVVYVIKITTDAGTFTKEVPVYCNPAGDPYHGDPCPDCGDPSPERQLGDPDPWDKGTIVQIRELPQEQRTR